MFLHVFCEVRFLSVRLSAVLTNVRFEVFRLSMLGNMFEETCLVGEALVAAVALEGLVRLV